MYRLIVVFFCFLTISTSAQMSYKEANDQSYMAFTEENWEQVIVVTQKAKQAGHDFYYLNLREAIANYQLNNYYSSIASLERLFESNSTEKIINQYLNWNYIALGDQQLAQSFQSNLKTLRSIEVNSGVNNVPTNIGSPLLYLNAATQFNTLSNVISTIKFSAVNQETIWGNFNQYQFFIGNTLLFSKQYRFKYNYHFITTSGNIDYKYNQTSIQDSMIFTTQGPTTLTKSIDSDFYTQGQIQQNQHVLYIELEKRKQRHTFQFGLGTRVQFENNAISQSSETTTTLKYLNNENALIESSSGELENNTNTHFQMDFGGVYHSKKMNNSLWYDYKISIPVFESAGLSLQGGITKAFKNKWLFNANFLYNSTYNTMEQQGAIINNGLDLVNFRFGAGVKYQINPSLQMKSSLNYSHRTEFYESTNYHSQSFNLGILYTL